MLPTPLINRMIILDIMRPTEESWFNWMENNFEGIWDKRIYGFLMRFKNEGMFIDVPRKAEGLDPYPTPRIHLDGEWVKLGLDFPY